MCGVVLCGCGSAMKPILKTKTSRCSLRFYFCCRAQSHALNVARTVAANGEARARRSDNEISTCHHHHFLIKRDSSNSLPWDRNVIRKYFVEFTRIFRMQREFLIHTGIFFFLLPIADWLSAEMCRRLCVSENEIGKHYFKHRQHYINNK